MSKVDDYVEAYVTDGLKRQLEQEENSSAACRSSQPPCP
jgi:hypothetical protein